MGTFENPTASADNEREQSINWFTQIDGIAGKTAQAIYEIGIRSYADLAHYLHSHTAEEVSLALKEHGLNRPPGLINMEAWTDQAEILSKTEINTPALTDVTSEPTRLSEEAPSNPKWQEHDAVFTVSFNIGRDEDGKPLLNTTVYDEKNAGKEKVFLGNDVSQWVNWILQRANLHLEAIPNEAGIEATALQQPPLETEALSEAEAQELAPNVSLESYEVQIKIDHLQLSPIEPTSDFPENMIEAEINFQLSGADAGVLAYQGAPYRIEIYTIDFGRGTPAFVASKDGQLKARSLNYTDQLKFALPGTGQYEFHSLVQLPPSDKLRAYYRGPTMSVSPSTAQDLG